MGLKNILLSGNQMISTVAAVLVLVAIVLFFAIFMLVIRLKNTKTTNSARIATKNYQQNAAKTTQDDKQAVYQFPLPEMDDDLSRNNRQNIPNLSARFATLSPGDKVLYAAAKKQLNCDGLTNHTTDICEVYVAHERPAARLIIYRGMIYLFVAIDPNTLDRSVYSHEDVSDREGYELLPTMIIIRDSVQIDKIPSLIDRLI